MRSAWLLALMLVGFAQSPCRASTDFNSGWDLGLETGMLTGQIRSPQSAGYGGFPVGAYLSHDASAHLAFQFEGHFVLDASNLLVTQFGVEALVGYSFWGGPETVTGDFNALREQLHFPFAFSLLAGLGLNKYSAAQGSQAPLSGGTFEPELGLQFRQSLTDESSLVLQLTGTLVTVPLDLTRISGQFFEFRVSYRFAI